MSSLKLPSYLLTTLGITAIATSALAAPASSGYLGDTSDTVVTSNYAECVQTGAWSKEKSTPACDAALAAQLEAERIAAKLAKMESPAALPKPALATLSDARNVVFEFNSAVLTPNATEDLERVVNMMKQYTVIDKISITGYTDSTGPEQYNQKLSEARAVSVKEFLQSRGVSPRLIAARGEGESSPVADNNTREGRSRNRRVDILISGNVEE
ncbi:MAG: OmpA family protein [Gammaproteobacteria bacterium]